MMISKMIIFVIALREKKRSDVKNNWNIPQ